MRVRDEGRSLEVVDTPVLHWLFCLLFVVVGGLFFLGPLGLFTDADRIRWWLRVLIAVVGGIAVGVGVWQLLTVPMSTLTIDRPAGRVRINRVGITGRSSSELSTSAIAAVELLERHDDEGNPIFQLRLFAHDAEPIVISPTWSHGREQLEQVARTLAAAIGVETVNVRPIESTRIVASS